MEFSDIETLIEARWLVPVATRGQVLENHAVVVRGGRITGIMPAPEARLQFPLASVVSLPEHALIPGLINLHTHAAMSLMRGLADDLPLMDWLNHHIWPAEGQCLSEQFVHDGTLVACAEMLRSGVTCFNDMYFFPTAEAEAVQHTGIRACIGLVVLDFPSPYASDADDYLQKGLAARDTLMGSERITTCLAPHAPYTISDKTFEKVLTFAEQLNLNIHIHLHETYNEIEKSLEEYGLRPLQRLSNLGLLGPNLMAAHCVHLTQSEIETLAAQGCHVLHCPTSNLKLASGIASLAGMTGAGINIGLGTDGAASNNRLDIFAEMRLAALLAKGATGNASAVPAGQALEMATINAARALGMDRDIGTIEPGKCADLTAVDFSGVEMQPCYDVISHLVYVAGRQQVSHVWVDGELLVKEGCLTRIGHAELMEKTRLWQNRLNKYKH
jgi:5-methylthioadenosine/S-adenosylhomocysteine deaminase